MKLLAMAIGSIIGAIGIVGVGAPSLLLEFGRSLLTPTALYIVAGLRIGIGIVFVRVAPISRMPKVLRVLGILVIIAGVLTPFFGVEHSRAVLDWWSNQGPSFMRVLASVAVAFGFFIVYVVTRRRMTSRGGG